jgi:hypothetical protein
LGQGADGSVGHPGMVAQPEAARDGRVAR